MKQVDALTITVHTEQWYDAAHYLVNYEGKCSNMHGHTYKVEVWVRGTENDLDEAGILWDFGKLKKLTNDLDHKNLNEVFNKKFSCNSTAEYQVLSFYKTLKSDNPRLQFTVRVYEQLQPKKSYAEVGDFQV